MIISIIMFTGCSNPNMKSESSSKENREATEIENTQSSEDDNIKKESEDNQDLSEKNSEEENENTMKIKIGEKTYTATLVDNSSTQALKEILSHGSLSIDMRDYENMEKVGMIGETLPRNDEQITTEAGDIILYQGNALVIYYDTNSWNFTRIGKIDGITQDELKTVLGKGNVTVTLY